MNLQSHIRYAATNAAREHLSLGGNIGEMNNWWIENARAFETKWKHATMLDLAQPLNAKSEQLHKELCNKLLSSNNVDLEQVLTVLTAENKQQMSHDQFLTYMLTMADEIDGAGIITKFTKVNRKKVLTL